MFPKTECPKIKCNMEAILPRCVYSITIHIIQATQFKPKFIYQIWWATCFSCYIAITRLIA